MTTAQQVKEFYNELQFPGPYDATDLSRARPEINNLYLKFIHESLSNNQLILDAGCGTGLVTNVMAQCFPNSRFVAVDFATSVDYGKQWADTHGINNVQWIKQDITEFDYAEKFDVIVCQGVLHHMPEWASALKRMCSMLRPGGTLLLGLYNPWGKLLKRMFSIKYNSDTLYQDQEHNPFELCFSAKKVLSLLPDFEFVSAVPGGRSALACDLLALFNSKNGGLTLYKFRSSYV